MESTLDLKTKSPRRKRARRAAACNNNVAKRLATEDKKVAIKFLEGGTVHSLPWSELLTLDEVPFESLEAVLESVKILAPWWDESTFTIKHAEAVIVSKGNKKSPTKGGRKSSPVKGKRKSISTKRTPTKKDSKKVQELALRTSSAALLKEFQPNTHSAMTASVHESESTSVCSSSATNSVNPNSLQNDNIITPQPTVASPPTSVTVVHPQLTTSTSQPTSGVPFQPATMPSFKPSGVSSSGATNEATGMSLSVLPPPNQQNCSAQSLNLSSQSSNSISPLSPQQPCTTLSQSVERFNIGMENNGLVQPPTPQGTLYSAIPSAMNTLLEMDYSDIHNEATISDSDYIDSGLSPNSSASFGHSMFNTTPPNIGLDRSFSLPPRPMWPRVHPKAELYRCTSSDYDGSASDCSSSSSYYPVRPPNYPDLNYVYVNWIEPIREQLNRLEKRFEQLSAPGSKASPSPNADSSSLAQKSKSKASHSGAPSPVFSSTSTSPLLLSSNEQLPSGDDVVLKEETYDGIGTYLGYSKSPKFREWISDLSPEELKRIEAGSKSAEGLAKSLFMVLFKQDLEQRPEEICATANRLEGRQLCDPAKLRAIRLHVCRKYPISKFGAEEESARWDSICKKLNGHIRYRRSAKKNKDSTNI